ncbi:CotH kinase family protein [Actinoplanes flavus]|uniref:CotH kinase family protein n=1 Tax=Actinoplanes flavus TaxID=2820290 RepID=A0ABS3V0H1_9ACTN|nr:CotH kinase family protein [Actinoplanes flavus]MBO3744335.1 CotH kinase family protein [Actinoplanes flavus]
MPDPKLSRRSFGAALAGAFGVAVLAGCGLRSATTAAASTSTTATAGSGLFDATLVHDIDVTFEQSDYDTMIDAFLNDGDKNWIEAGVTIDGTTFEKAGLRLKGNSSLKGLTKSGSTGNTGGRQQRGGGPGGSVSAENPQDLPWLVRLDKFTDGQAYGGYTDFVVRSNTTKSALNEAVALELLGLAGLATQRSASTRLTVNGGDQVLRLIVENLSDKWDADNFGAAGILYKAESGGDYAYRGEDVESYKDVFDQETDSDNPNLAPLIAFLKFINQSKDEAFASGLASHLDVSAFATYLAFQELVKNSDDIDGPGNNSYLRYTTGKDQFTVVAWDHNLAFGGMGGGGRGGNPGGDQMQPPADGGQMQPPADGGQMQPPADGGEMQPPADGGQRDGNGGGGGRPGGRSNILVQRFNADTTFKAAYEKALTDLKAALYTSGKAAEILQRRAAVLTAHAGDLVPADTVTSESDTIRAYFTA